MARKNDILSIYTKEVEQIKADGLFKGEAPFVSPQGAKVVMEDGRELLNMCANNYLGLGDNQRLIDAAKRTYDEKGYGVASVRFICGTQDIHKKLEKKISGFLGTDDTILYSSCFDANGGLFETILTAEDAVISDELNHASIIDGVRLCKAKRYRYKNNNMEDLEAQLQAADAAGARVKLIATDGVFSMDGIICNLKGVCDLADKYNALVMVDDSHAVGFVGAHGRGTSEYCGVEGRGDIITGTLGKALGGASGGYTSGRKEIIDLLRQRSRPYLFSNSLAPAIAGASIEMFNMLEESTELRDHLEEVTAYYRTLFFASIGVNPGKSTTICDVAGLDSGIVSVNSCELYYQKPDKYQEHQKIVKSDLDFAYFIVFFCQNRDSLSTILVYLKILYDVSVKSEFCHLLM